MLKSLGILAVTVLAATLSPVNPTAEASPAPTPTSPISSMEKRGVTLTASATDVEEGSRLDLVAKVKNPAQGTRVTLQRWDVESEAWEDVKTKQARGKAKVKFKAVATALNSERFRAEARLDGHGSKSEVVSVTVWRWIPLSEYPAYFETKGVYFGQVQINGQEYAGWGPGTSSHVGAWESKFTPGRNCKGFRGVLGLSDISADGSTGVVKITAEEVVVYQSPTLTPGMAVPITLPIALPYRLGLQALDTSTGLIESWPAVGDPALLCTNVD